METENFEETKAHRSLRLPSPPKVKGKPLDLQITTPWIMTKWIMANMVTI